MNTFELSLDLDKRTGVPQWVILRQGDRRGTELRATIYDHGEQVGGGYSCRVSIRLPGPGAEYYRETANYSNGVAVVTVNEEYAAAVVGNTYGYFELLQGSTVIASTESFGVRVLPSAQDGAVPGEKYDSAIEDALAELDEATGRISQMVQDATAEYLEAHPEITTTVQDNSITDAKLIQKGGILSREQWLETMLPNIPRKTTAEADVHSVTDSAGGGPLGIEVYGRSTQDGTPTPSAPVAIQSVEPDSDGGVNMVAAGRNLLDPQTFASRSTVYTVNADGSVTVLSNDGATWTTAPTIELPAGTYTFSWGTLRTGQVRYRTSNDSYGADVLVNASAGKATFTLASDGGVKVKLAVAVSSFPYTEYPQLEVGSVAHDFEPYKGVNIPIDLGGRSLRSLPDGTRDEVVVDEWGHAILTQRVMHYAITQDSNIIKMPSPRGDFYEVPLTATDDPYGGASGSKVQIMRCNITTSLINGDTEWMTSSCVWAYVTGTTRRIRLAAGIFATFSSVDELKAWLATTPIEVDYRLLNERTIDLGYLDPALLPAPDLTAYVVPSAPSVLRYGFDVAAAIARLEAAGANLAPVDGPTAETSHAAGSYLVLDGRLVRATRPIVAGETIAIGTNVAATTVAAEIDALR